MHNTAAHALLYKKLGEEDVRGNNVRNNSVIELASTLEYMPLALVQAAVYIRKRALR